MVRKCLSVLAALCLGAFGDVPKFSTKLYKANSPIVRFEKDMRSVAERCHGRAKRAAPIHNGRETAPMQFPSAVRIEVLLDVCTGSLISPRHVLTAAHCFVAGFLKGRRLFSRNSSTPFEFVKQRGTAQVIYCISEQNCPSYKTSKKIRITNVAVPSLYFIQEFDALLSDIALVELEEEVALGPNFEVETVPSKPLGVHCLPMASQTFPIINDPQYAMFGWGMTDDGQFPERLQFLHQIRQITPADPLLKNRDSMAFKYKNLNSYPMNGDSGAPLFFPGRAGLQVMGAVLSSRFIYYSHKSKTTITGLTIEATGVRDYLPWICETTGVCYSNQNAPKMRQ